MSLIIDSRKFPAFPSIIGQEPVKTALEEMALAILNGGALPCIGFYDAPGTGKSAITQSWACSLAHRSGGKILAITLNCKGTLNRTSEEFKELSEYIYDALQGRGPAVLLILDEFGTREAKGSGQAALTAMLSKVGGDAVGGETIIVDGQGEATFSPHRLGVIVTSWAGDRIPADIRDRFKQTHALTLQDYSAVELSEILKLSIARQLRMEGIPGESVKLHPSALMLLARAMRGNARQCDNPLAKLIARRVKARGGDYLLDKKEGAILRAECGLLPFGISLLERDILRHLKRCPDTASGVKASTGAGAESFAVAARFLRFGHKEEQPFQLMRGDEPVTGAFGPLIVCQGARWSVTKHGLNVLGILG